MSPHKIFVLAALFISIAAGAQKIATVNEEAILNALPEMHKVDSLVTAFQQDSIGGGYTKLLMEYKRIDSIVKKTTNKSLKDSSQRDLEQITGALQNWRQIAEQANTAKQNQLIAPLFQKVRAAVIAYAKEKGYAYVLHKSATVVSSKTDDITLAVAQKLGIKKMP